ncbi:MAG: hypothetical protein P8Y34_07870 [Anaerolineales bacterium]
MDLATTLEGFRINWSVKGYSPATIKTYLSCLKKLTGFLGD